MATTIQDFGKSVTGVIAARASSECLAPEDVARAGQLTPQDESFDKNNLMVP